VQPGGSKRGKEVRNKRGCRGLNRGVGLEKGLGLWGGIKDREAWIEAVFLRESGRRWKKTDRWGRVVSGREERRIRVEDRSGWAMGRFCCWAERLPRGLLFIFISFLLFLFFFSYFFYNFLI
jgi:hypothetical protein